MNHPAFVRRVLALVLTAAVAVAAALPGFAVYAMPIQTTYPQESIYLFDANTGEALVEQNPDMVRHVASLTKMMTALLVIENGSDLNASITIPDSLTPEFQSIKGQPGPHHRPAGRESVRRIDMLYAMLLPSANDAASVLASDAAGGDLAAFAARMNARASQLGCTTTHSPARTACTMPTTIPPRGTWRRSRWPVTRTRPTGSGRHGTLPAARHQRT